MLKNKQMLSLVLVSVMLFGITNDKGCIMFEKNVVASTASMGAISSEPIQEEGGNEVVTPSAVVSSDALNVSKPKKVLIKLKAKKIILGKGEKVAIPFSKKPKKVKYVISKYGIISISKDGVITGKKTGTVTVKISKGEYSATLKVQVKKKPSRVILREPAVDSVTIGTKIPLQLILGKKEASYQVTWKSSQKKVATVDKNGVITVKGTGLTVISATTYNGKVGKIKLRFQ